MILFFYLERLEKQKEREREINAFKNSSNTPVLPTSFHFHSIALEIRSPSKANRPFNRSIAPTTNPPKFHPKSTHQQRVPTPYLSKEDYNYLTVAFKHITDPQQSLHNPAIFPRLLRLAETLLLLLLLLLFLLLLPCPSSFPESRSRSRSVVSRSAD